MRTLPSLILIGALLAASPAAWAQRTTKGRAGAPKSSGSAAAGLVARMMQFDADKDGKLTKDEVTDDRLLRVFDRADTNQDGTVTKAELTAMSAKVASSTRPGRGGFGDGPPPGGGSGMGMRGPRPKPGEVLPQMVQQRLKLSADQQAQVKALQKEVDAKLAKILTSEQKDQLEEIQAQGPPGGPGGPPPGGFGGPPPGEFGEGPGGDGGPPPPGDF